MFFFKYWVILFTSKAHDFSLLNRIKKTVLKKGIKKVVWLKKGFRFAAANGELIVSDTFIRIVQKTLRNKNKKLFVRFKKGFYICSR